MTPPNAPAPLLLRADNFTPPSRTPWGGTRIVSVYKQGVPMVPERAAYPRVGESWEISVEPDFPSIVEATGERLADALARDLVAWVGAEAVARVGGCPLLVKLLDAAEDLSLQIHPPDDYEGLEEGQSGKPESWYVLDAGPGAGLYLGPKAGVERGALRSAIRGDGEATDLLFFVPVQPGDFFVIEAGTAHAIGRGVTLVEPQRVLPGRRGVTYRYWDWNRRYDAEGRPDPSGRPRVLHLEHALAVTDWSGPREEALVARIRHRAGPADAASTARIEPLGGPDAPVRSAALSVQRLAGTGTLTLAPERRLRGLTVVGGTVTILGDDGQLVVGRGRSAALPAEIGAVRLDLEGAHAVLASAAA